MSLSVLEPFSNATLTFQVGAGAFSVDPETGNAVEATSAVVVRAYLKQTSQSKQDRLPGVGVSAVFMTGWASDPAILPDSIRPLTQAIAQIDGKDGRFLVALTIQKPAIAALGLSGILGTPLAGYFDVIGGD